MKTLYLDCKMGAAGDMLAAALTELLPDPDLFLEKLNALAIPGVRFAKETVAKCGINGTHFSVTVDGMEEDERMYDRGHAQDGHEHDHDKYNHGHDHDGHEHAHHHHHGHGMREIGHIVENLRLPAKIKEDILAVYRLIAEAESHVHGMPVDEIHFHEVGSMDAVADITAVCLLMHEILPDEIVVSPVHVGSGTVKCAHGILPVPAPATAYLLREIPIYGGEVTGELCTPTGAALLRYFATRFGSMPVMRVRTIGYGMGKKDFPVANCLRAMLEETEDMTKTTETETEAETETETETETEADGMILELSCNVDDMTAEEIGFAMERLFEGGALEVYTVPVGMKKCRPGTMLRVMCAECDREKMVRLLFRHTTTIGIRENKMRRYTLKRTIEERDTGCGKVKKKISLGYGILREKYEFEDIARIAREKGISLAEAKKRICDGEN